MCTLQVATFGAYRLVNIYAPSGSSKKQERETFYGQDLFSLLQLPTNFSWIWAGDYNCVLERIDIENGVNFNQKKSICLETLVRTANLSDVFRSFYPLKNEFTFYRPGCAASRLDRFYVSNSLLNDIIGVSHVPSLSDHCAVKVKMKIVDSFRVNKGSLVQSYWKLNSSILRDENFLTCFKPLWKDISSCISSFSDIAEWWDVYAKPCIKQFCVNFSVKRQSERSQRKEFLLSYLGTVLRNKDWEEVGRIKSDLNKMLHEDLMGFTVRSRFKQNAEEEKSSLFHAARELKNKRCNIEKLKINGNVTEDNAEIENEVLRFYGALFNGHHDTNLVDTGSTFSPDNTYLDEMLEDVGVMDRVEAESMEEDFGIEELDLVIKECPYNKAPGLDGLSYEFYRITWSIIRETFLMIVQCQLDRGRILDSDKIGATRLLSKVSGVPTVQDLRPITLLNCDYRILAKLLVKRIKPSLPSVIRSGQLCTVGKKNILFGISNILSSILLANQKKQGACLISLDFFKAYDRVLVSFLLHVMRKMGFRKKFCNWIKMLHEGAKTRFLLKKLSKAIDICFSIRQGDPLAMILYIIYVEPLLVYIEKRIVGLSLPYTLSSQQIYKQGVEGYCDDLNVMTRNDNDFRLGCLGDIWYSPFNPAVL